MAGKTNVITFNAPGPQGPVGPRGPNGPAGLTGQTGPAGPSGFLNARSFGARPNDSSTAARIANTAAHIAMQTSLAALPIPVAATEYWQQGDYYFAADPRDTSAAIHLTRPVHLMGDGSHFWAGTQFFIPDGLVGIKTWHYGQSGPSETIDDDSSGATITDIVLMAEGQSSTVADGILLQSHTTINRGRVDSFGGHGIHCISGGGAFSDNWRVDGTRVTNCQDGIHVQGSDANNGLCISGDFQNNRGWGVYDQSFLGSGWVECHTAENCIGPYFCLVTGVSTFLNCYSEQDQPPSSMQGGVFVVGGLHGAGFTPNSQFFGSAVGASSRMQGTGFYGSAGSNVTEFSSTGTNPPRIGIQLTNLVHPPSSSLIIEVTTAGFPGGRDSFGNVQTALIVKYSIDGGSTWTINVAPTRADKPQTSGLSSVALGASGATVYFTPYLYSLDNVYTMTITGGLQTQFFAGSVDGTCAAYSWRHEPSVAGSDASADTGTWSVGYNTTLGRWQQSWKNSIVSKEWVGSQSLPTPGVELHQYGLWTGSAANDYNRQDWVDGSTTVGSSTFLNSTNAFTWWFSTGDILWNRSQTTIYPLGFRPTQRGGQPYTASGGYNQPWTAGQPYQTGDTVKSSSTATGFLYRANTRGTSTATEPTWPGIGGTVIDGGVTWENVGIIGNVFEPFGLESPMLSTKDCTAAGTITLTLTQASAERIKLTGSPGVGFNLVLPSGAATGWVRVIWNTSGQIATVYTASTGNTGVAIPTGHAYQILSDGTDCVRVE